MTLQLRTLLMVMSLLVVTVVSTAAVLAWNARQSLLAQTEADGLLIARLLARSTVFADEIAGEVETAIGEQMIVEATIAAHLVAVAEAAGIPPDTVNARLRDITDRTALDEFWITDERGHAYLRNQLEIDFTFSPNAQEQPQASVFWPLLTAERQTVVQEARQREVDTQVYKYAGVGGVDKPRIVQVGYHARFLEQLYQRVGLTRLIDELVGGGQVSAIRIVDPGLTTLAYRAAAGQTDGEHLAEADAVRLGQVLADRRPASFLTGSHLAVMVPIVADKDGRLIGAALVRLPTAHVQAAIRRQLELASVVAGFVLAVGLGAAFVMARRITHPVEHLTAAAAAVETGAYQPESLAGVVTRTDELGQLARVFQRMAREVYSREERLKQQVQELRIEIDEHKKARHVAEITETDYFQQLQKKAQELRIKRERPATNLER